MDANKFTKHYYAGSTRVSSKIGNGRFENQFRSGVFEITAGSVNYIARQQNLKQGYQNYIQNLGIPPGPPTMKGINGDPYNSGKAINPVNDVNTKVPSGWPGEIIFAPPGGPPGAPIQYGDSITNNTAEPGFGYIGTGTVEENLRYFFHSDHLGSTSYITNAMGEITQFVGYMPFGECFVEQHTDYDSPYKFNGKEMDSETGLCYYNVRYFDPKTARFINVDPIIEKFPELTPYNYASNNPTTNIDLWGLQGLNSEKTRYYLELNLSFGPQVGIKANIFGFGLGINGQFKNVERKMKVGFETSDKGTKTFFDSELKNINYMGKTSIPFYEEKSSSEYGGQDHPSFAKDMTETTKGYTELATEENETEITKETSDLKIEPVAAEIRFLILGVEFNIGAQTSNKQTEKKTEEVKRRPAWIYSQSTPDGGYWASPAPCETISDHN